MRTKLDAAQLSGMFLGGYALIAYTQYDDGDWAVGWIEAAAYLRVPPTTVPTRLLVAPLNRVPAYLN